MKPDPNSAASVVCRLLFRALVEMRMQGHETGDKLVYRLADLFHHVPLDLEAAAHGEAAYDDVLRSLSERAAVGGVDRWLDAALADQSDRPAVQPAA